MRSEVLGDEGGLVSICPVHPVLIHDKCGNCHKIS